MRVAGLRPIIDSHHHLWQLGRHPYVWLAPDAPPRPFGDHAGLKRDYLLNDYLRDIDGLNVVGSVFVEANSGAPAAEIAWVDEVASGVRLPNASVGNLDLRGSEVKGIVAEFCRSPRMRGVRMSLAWHARTTAWRFVDRPDVMRSREFRDGLKVLTDHGLVFDTVVVPQQLSQLADLARAHPDQPIVIDHLGTPWFESDVDRATWMAGMKDCADCANVFVKLSGLWTLDHGWRPDVIGAPVRYVVDLFGPERCMWASNFPVEKLMCSLRDQLGNLEEVLSGLTEDQKDMVFRRTAKQVYRVG
jgi:predicted TIM-barrel fold metal-dependent hydrolase